MLVASGAGSCGSRRVIAGNDTRLMRVLAGVAILVAILAFAAPALTAGAVSWPLPAKMLITALASGGAIVLSIYTVLQATLLFGGALYLIALVVILATRVQRS